MSLTLGTSNRTSTTPQAQTQESGGLPGGVMRQQARGEGVAQVQNALNALGFDAGAADGVFGRDTASALRSFQQANGLPADGVYGPKTRAAMEASLGAQRPGASNTAASPADPTSQNRVAADAGTQAGSRLRNQGEEASARARLQGQLPAQGVQQNATPAAADRTPFYSQFVGGNGFTPGRTACFKAASAMTAAGGGTTLPPGNRIQVATGEDRQGRVTVSPEGVQAGRARIDAQLDAGRPVTVGVSHKDPNVGNVDGLTDHFVTITGRGVDEQGRTFYKFHDPATQHTSRGADTNPNNRFYVDPDTGNLYRPGAAATGPNLERRYELSMVR
jgi:peptidoglycan hydrolase-like protein with peptidoglycan-binding domain